MRAHLNTLFAVALIVTLLIGNAVAQTMDYNLSQAIRAFDSISSGLQRLQPSDVNGFNRLKKKLDKATTLLQSSESKSHPEYASTVQKYKELEQQLAQLATGQTPESSVSSNEQADQQKTQPAVANQTPQTSATEQTTAAQQNQNQTMDYNLSQAIRDINAITSGLNQLRENDINGFNRLSVKLNKAAELLQNSASKSHPNFQPAVQQWTALQQHMSQIALALQQAQQQQQQQLAEQKAQQAAEIERKKQAKAAEEARAAEQAALQAQTLLTVLNPMVARYSRESLPILVEAPSPEQAREWATTMHQLQTSQLEEDVATLDSLLATGAATEEDARRVKFWINDGSQRAIAEAVRDARLIEDGAIASMQYSAELINAADPANMNEAYRFAGGDKYENNKQRLNNALRAGAVVEIYNSVFGPAEQDSSALLGQISAALEKLEVLKPIADEQAIVLANAEPAKPAVKKDFLAPIAQEFWLDGNLAAESDTDGSIWVDGNKVGHITHNGEIWIQSNEMGSIEPNGEVWFDANLVGSLEPNGEVWRESNQVGLIEQDGTVWVNSNPSGEITPFQGEWKRAAIIYYFADFFR